MRRRFVAVVASVLALALVLAGCGQAAGNPTLGRYEGYATTVFGESTAFDATYTEGENYLELKEGNVATLCLDGSQTEGTYTLDGEDITVTIGDSESGETYDSKGTVKDGVLTIDFLGVGIELTFLKDGAKAPFALSDEGASTSTSTGTTTTDEQGASDDAAAEQDDATDAQPDEDASASEDASDASA